MQKKLGEVKVWEDMYISDVKNFHYIGRISSTLGITISELNKQSNYEMLYGEKITVTKDRYVEQ